MHTVYSCTFTFLYNHMLYVVSHVQVATYTQRTYLSLCFEECQHDGRVILSRVPRHQNRKRMYGWLKLKEVKNCTV